MFNFKPKKQKSEKDTKKVKSTNNKTLNKNPFLTIFLSTFLFLIISFVSLGFYFRNKVLPNIFATKISLAGKTIPQTEEILRKKINPPQSLSILVKDQELKLSLDEIGFSYDFPKTSLSAYSFYRSKKFPFYSLEVFNSLKDKREIKMEINLDYEKLNEYVSVVSAQLSEHPIYPIAKLENDEIVVEKGKAGEIIDSQLLKNQIIENLKNADFSPVLVKLTKIDQTISDEKAEKLKQRASNLIGKSLELEYDGTSLILPDAEIVPAFFDVLLNLPENRALGNLVEKVKQNVEREAQDAVFKFENGKVIEFTPAKEGLTIKDSSLENDLRDALLALESSEDSSINIDLPLITSSPEITTDSVNDLGINRLIGRGNSSFRGSVSARIYNIGLASSKFNGVLIAPGEIFSFNRVLGDISTYTGYKQAYIIKDGKTILGDGGGVCQVSTTMFRAALNAGLPIVERRAHSYRVSYYEQDSAPGIDATVYSPTTDLKFKNDTPGYILIQTLYDESARTLSFEFYGTDDGRVSSISKPKVYGVTPPPEDLYIDDPTLPAGEVKQIDYKAWGAKASFNYEVRRNDEPIYEKTFYSNYQPWQAKFLRGTGAS